LTDVIQIIEEKTLADYIRRIDPLLECACRSGIAIARELADAEASLKRKDFKALREHYHISYSTARKLVKVGRSDRIKQYEDKLACIDAWSTLHELVKLDETPFNQEDNIDKIIYDEEGRSPEWIADAEARRADFHEIVSELMKKSGNPNIVVGDVYDEAIALLQEREQKRRLGPSLDPDDPS
jgi:hypothetical protein